MLLVPWAAAAPPPPPLAAAAAPTAAAAAGLLGALPAPPLVCVLGFRWLVARVMLGAGLIKVS